MVFYPRYGLILSDIPRNWIAIPSFPFSCRKLNILVPLTREIKNASWNEYWNLSWWGVPAMQHEQNVWYGYSIINMPLWLVGKHFGLVQTNNTIKTRKSCQITARAKAAARRQCKRGRYIADCTVAHSRRYHNREENDECQCDDVLRPPPLPYRRHHGHCAAARWR